ncbi:RIIa domain-containing protein 1 isoform X4 [Sagmatias obliquidens]|uniref:RIIa domain-containing protein 1 isoform X4 n=1 Tax=Tursiops truncatus TaxID=9739 RepID=A0A6J3RM21_TURTR|nr:RIIa domain-containing protein 1 isoform X4 [Lagenorhynchus obliquidens]XP_030702211.1 RIIa domain-containing protein 1 isoform X4 [Globicephala melas]XP_033715153.1 RIIa domain-containing protein 1 isoform X4 [Tursiops truncatus]
MATLPGGIQGLYPEALSPEQLEKLRGFKIQTRITNEKYLRTHKEVELLISGFFRVIWKRESPVAISVGFRAVSAVAKAFKDAH